MVLNMEVLERFRLQVATRPVSLSSKKSRALLAYLALRERHEATRENIVGLLWSNSPPSHGRASLRQAIYQIQTQMLVADGSALEAENEVVRLPARDVVVDVLEAIRFAAEGTVHPTLLSQQRVLERMLVDLEPVDPMFSECVLAQRLVLQDRLRACLERSVQKASCAKQQQEILQALLHLDPTNEAAARQIMVQRAQNGDIGGALRIYKSLWDTLDKEFDVEPTADTQSLAVALKLERPVGDLCSGNLRVDEPPKRLAILTRRELPGEGLQASVTESFGFPLLPTPQLPSIAVLPFRNTCTGATDGYFGDGIVEDILISLAGLRELFVISRGSTLGFRFYEYDPVAIGKLLGVRYLISGNIRRVGDQIRITVELCETEGGRSIWGERWNASCNDLFDLQDQLVADVTAKIAPHIRQEELRRALRKPPSSLTAYDHFLRALDLINRRELQSFKQAELHLQEAHELEPTFAQPFAWSAWTRLYRIGVGWSSNVAADAEQSASLASRALEPVQTNRFVGL
jgi:DNA-binding SARP family transcriptional activator/TolB-like protein